MPTAADDVYFDAASGAVTVSQSATVNCRALNFTGFTGTFANNTNLQAAGSITFVTGMTLSASGTLRMYGALSTLTSAGKTIGSLEVGIGSPADISLTDALICSGSITVTSGTLNTNNFNVTATALLSSNGNTRAINLGNSTVTLTSATPFDFANSTGLSFNAGTSSVIITGNITTFSPTTTASLTFYNVSFTNTSTATRAFSSAVTGNTFNNLTIAGPSAIGVTQITFNSHTTINGTLSTTGTAGNRRVWFRGVTYGLAQTLTINSAPSLTDADFRDIYIVGAAAPISGTRIGDLRGNSGITFSTPKTVYWNLAGGGNSTSDAWATISGGAVSTDNFPLAQDTAVINNTGLGVGSAISLAIAIPYIGTIDMSSRTTSMSISIASITTIYGNWINGFGTSITGAGSPFFSGRKTQTITSSGKSLGAGGIFIDSYGGTVELVDALNIGSSALTITNGTLDTKGYAVTAGELSSSNSNVRAINLGASTLTLSGGSAINFSDSTNLTFNAGTSNISVVSGNVTGGSQTFYNITWTAAVGTNIAGNNTFNNVTVNAPAATGRIIFTFSANQIISGTLTVAGASPVRRIFVQSTVLGTQRDLTVGTLVATDCDFRDIDILGAAAGSTPTRAGDCGGNAGITFPAPKTVYWNLAGAQNWSATGWAASSGGTPDINNFPLAQDTAVFNDTGSVTGTITINAAWNIGTFDASARTNAMTLAIGSVIPVVMGDWKWGTGVTASGNNGQIQFSSRGTQTITSNGRAFSCNVIINSISGTVELADAITISLPSGLFLLSGVFDAINYNVTATSFSSNYSPVRTLKMGSGTWTFNGGGTVWNAATTTNFIFYKGTANIVLSDTGTTPRAFDGGGLSYNKLTIGGATGTSILTFSGNNQFTELASTKTVAHTINFGTTTQTFGAWTVTGTVGNVVTVTGSGSGHIIAGARVSGVDYLAMGNLGFAPTSPGEFYAGANSTGNNASASLIFTAAPAAVTRYWRGGTGTWNATTTTNWSASSGGAGGASVPTSADAVVFDTLSNATAYTVTCTATQLRCGSLTMAGPLTGNVTWAGTAPLAIHDNVSLAATGITRTYNGPLTLSGSSTVKTFTTNGVQIASNIIVNGVNCGWNLGSELSNGTGSLNVTNGLIDFVTYNYTTDSFTSNGLNERTISFGSGTITFNSFNIGSDNNTAANLTINPGTGQINCLAASPTFSGNGKTFYNVAFTSTSAGTVTLNGTNTFNNLSFTGITSAGLKNVSLTANQTINGTLTLSAGTNATMRHFLRSDTLGTTRTLTCAAVSATDADFRDIIIAGAAAPASGTRLGDCKGNSGITFDAAKTVYYAVGTGLNWGGNSWTLTNGASADPTAFPLAQDTAVFPSSPSARPGNGGACTINANYNIGTIDMSARTSNTMTLATGSTAPTIYGNWINGTGTTLTGSGNLTFSGRGSQTITSAGKTFTQPFIINSPNGSVTLQDAISFSINGFSLILNFGTFNANGYNLTATASGNAFESITTNIRTLNLGSGTWTIAGSGTAWNATLTNLTVTGTGTISLTSASAKTFAGGGISYSGITLNQGGAGTLTITGNNTFANITNTYKATGATSIALGTTTQRVGAFGASGEAGRVLTVTGTSATSPATLIFTGSGQATTPTTDYLTITGVRAYSLDTTWYAGNNSTNNGSLGWYFVAGVVVAGYLGNFFAFF